jgi:hypothetical protein
LFTASRIRRVPDRPGNSPHRHSATRWHLAAQRICIFCGDPPEDKNKEHPLPRWLLAMTGDPNRVVRHGYRWSDGKIFEFSFDSLVFPACTSCNERFSAFQGHAKTVVESLCRKEPITPENYVFLLDWLDKVRIGLWLGYRYLQQNPHPPNFAINSRLGAKNRMVAVYPLADHQRGDQSLGTRVPALSGQAFRVLPAHQQHTAAECVVGLHVCQSLRVSLSTQGDARAPALRAVGVE